MVSKPPTTSGKSAGVKFLDLGRLHSSIRQELDACWSQVVGSSAFIGGAGPQFEANFASAHRRAGAAGCNSGTDALVLALRAAGLTDGDEILVPSMTFAATAEAVLLAGGVPVILDVDPESLLMTADITASGSSAQTRGALPVHLYGNMVERGHLTQMVADLEIVVEDAAQAHLAVDADGSMPGEHTRAACFSFFPGKNLGAFGDAGAVVSDDLDLLSIVRLLRDHGRTSKYQHDVVGLSSRLDGLQAAILDVKLSHLAGWTAQRREIASHFDQALADIGGIEIVKSSPGSARHLYVVRVDAVVRDGFRANLAELGIATGVHYPVPLSLQPAYARYVRDAAPVAEKAAQEIVSLPLDPLMTAEEVERVIDGVGRARRSC